MKSPLRWRLNKTQYKYILILFVIFAFNETSKDKRLEGHNNCSETDSLLGGYGESGRQNANSVPAKNEETKEEPNEDECKPSLLQTLWEGLFGKEFAMAVMCDLLNCFLVFLQPLLLRLVMNALLNNQH